MAYTPWTNRRMDDRDAAGSAILQLGGFVVTRNGKFLTHRQVWVRALWLPLGIMLAAIALMIAAAWFGWMPPDSGFIGGGGSI